MGPGFDRQARYFRDVLWTPMLPTVIHLKAPLQVNGSRTYQAPWVFPNVA
jgi:hypothetical protein